MKQDKLEDLRKKIEAIDDQILQLLQQRSQVVHDVSLYKQGLKEDLFVKPLREATLLKKFDAIQQNFVNQGLKTYTSDFYRHFLRLVISASNQLEQDFCIGFVDGQSVANICFYYGAFCKSVQFNSFKDCLNQIISNKIQVAFLPQQASIDEGNFDKMREHGVHVFAQTTDVNPNFANNFIIGKVKFSEQDFDKAKQVILRDSFGMLKAFNPDGKNCINNQLFAGLLF